MKHARQKIREQVASTLSAISGVTVERSRVYALVSLPVISVYGNGESLSGEVDGMTTPIRYSRTLRLEIEIAVEAVSNCDDLADDYAAQVEALMAADLTLNGTATTSELVSTQIEMSGDGDTPVSITRMTYEVEYRTTGVDPETPL